MCILNVRSAFHGLRIHQTANNRFADLGHSRSYMQNISSGRSKPSIEEFLYICDYLGTTPGDFFDEKNQEPILIQKALSGMRSLSEKELLSLISLIDLFNENRKNMA